MLPVIGLGLLVLSAILIGGIYPAIVQQFQVEPSRAGQGGAVHREEHRRDPRGVRHPDDVESSTYPARRPRSTKASCVQDADDAAGHPPDRPDAGGARRSSSCSRSAASTRCPTCSTSTATPSAANRRAGHGRRGSASSTSTACRRTSATGPTTTPSTPTATASSPPTATGAASDGEPVWVGEATCRRPASSATYRAADLLRRDESPTTRSSARRRARRRSSSTTPHDAASGGQRPEHRPTPARAACRSARPSTSCCTPRSSGTRTSCCPGGSTPTRKILYDRDPRERVEKVAPWLTLDGDPYPAVVDGQHRVDPRRLHDHRPTTRMSDARSTSTTATSDSLTRPQARPRDAAGRQVNYIRNSVKATVDAYDGTVTLYQWDENDPMLKTWMRAFPGVGQAEGRHPAPSCWRTCATRRTCSRCSATLLAQYHVTDAAHLLQAADCWKVPDDPTDSQSATTRAAAVLPDGQDARAERRRRSR